jgi:hypothetical protein
LQQQKHAVSDTADEEKASSMKANERGIRPLAGPLHMHEVACVRAQTYQADTLCFWAPLTAVGGQLLYLDGIPAIFNDLAILHDVSSDPMTPQLMETQIEALNTWVELGFRAPHPRP